MLLVRHMTTSVLSVLLAAAGLAQENSPSRVLRNGTDAVAFLRFSPDGRYLARICRAGPPVGAVAIFESASYRKIRSFDIGMRMVAWNPAATLLATAEGTDGARVWDAAAEGKPVSGFSLPNVDEVRVLSQPIQVLAPPGLPRSQVIFWAEFSPDGSRLITVDASATLKIRRTDSWTAEREISVGQETRSVAFNPDGTMYVGDRSGAIHAYDLATGKQTLTLKSPAPVTALVMAPNGKTFVTIHVGLASLDALIWSVGRTVATVKPNVGAAAYSPDSKTLVPGGESLELVDPETPQSGRTIALDQLSLAEANPSKASMPNSDRQTPIAGTALAVSPDGKTLAVGLYDTSTRLLNWPN
jgi:WD40 repeat protein